MSERFEFEKRGRSVPVIAVLIFFSLSCGNAPENDLRMEGPEVAADQSTAAAPRSDRATLTTTGGPLAFPGTYELSVNCQYLGRQFALTAFPEDGMNEGPTLTNIWPSGPLAAFTVGTYPGRYEVNENQGDGRILTYFGPVEFTVASIAHDDTGQAVAEIEASGQGDDGVKVEFTASCQVLGA